MACVYVIYSKKLNCYYTGSCLAIFQRLADHLSGTYANSFTSKAKD
ncbi:GIY-YIG nuclease family protein [Pedobacter rhodius]